MRPPLSPPAPPLMTGAMHVHGHTADELIKRAMDEIRKLAGDRGFKITRCDAQPAALAGSGDVISWEAIADFEIST